MTLQISIATSNQAKIQKIIGLLDGLDVEIVAQQQFIDFDELTDEETQDSHLAIAVAKACHASKRIQEITIATDGGVTIPILGQQWSSLRTRRNLIAQSSSHQKAEHLLRMMEQYTGDQRSCYWTEAIAIARSGILLNAWQFNGKAGRINIEYAATESTEQGFWFDGLWTSCEGVLVSNLSEGAEKNSLDPWQKLRIPVRKFISGLR